MTLVSTPLEVEQSLLELGERLSLRRRLSGLTQSDLADRIGVGTSSIVALERGSTGVAIGTMARVLWALRALDDLDAVVETPELPEIISRVPRRIRAKKAR